MADKAPQKLATLVGGDGALYDFPADKVGGALARGFRVQTAAELDEQRKQEAYGEGFGPALGAGVAGAARSLTVGLSDQALVNSGMVTPEELRETKDRNPGAALAGEVAGVVGPALVSAGAGALAGAGVKGAAGVASGAEAIGGAVTGVAKLGGAAEALTAKAIAKLAPNASTTVAGRILSKVAPRVAAGAVEGAVFGAGQEVSEAALGDYDLTAERVLASAGVGAVLGGGLNGALGLGKAAIDEVPQGVKDAIRDAAQRPVKAAADAAGRFLDPERSRALAVGARAKELDPTKGERFQRAIERQGKGGFFEGGEVAVDFESGGFQRVADGKLPNQEAMLKRARGAQDEIGKKLDGVFREADDFIAGAAPEVRAKFSAKLSGLEKEEADGLLAKIEKKRASGAISPSQAEKFSGLVEEVGGLVAEGGGSLRKLQDLKLGLSERIKPLNFEKTAAPEVEMLKDLRKMVQKKVEAGVDMLKNETSYAGQAKKLAGVQKLNETWGDMETIAKTLERAIGQKNGNVNIAGLRWRDMMSGAGVGHVLGPVAGVAAAFATKAAQSPQGYLLRAQLGEKAKVLAGMAKRAKAVSQDISGAVDRFIGVATQTGRKTSIPASITALHDTTFAASEDGTHPKRASGRVALFKQRAAEIAHVASSPEQTMERIARTTERVGAHAPNVTQQMQLAALRAAKFLHEKAPKNPAPANILNPLIDNWRPSDDDIAKWERYVAAVENPRSVLEDMNAGRLTSEGVEALKAVYPRMYQEVVQTVSQKVSSMKTQLPYKQRVTLSVLLGVPIDPSMAPGFVDSIQKMHAQGMAEQTAQDQKMASGAGHAANVDWARPHQTQIERIASR